MAYFFTFIVFFEKVRAGTTVNVNTREITNNKTGKKNIAFSFSVDGQNWDLFKVTRPKKGKKGKKKLRKKKPTSKTTADLESTTSAIEEATQEATEDIDFGGDWGQ